MLGYGRPALLLLGSLDLGAFWQSPMEPGQKACPHCNSPEVWDLGRKPLWDGFCSIRCELCSAAALDLQAGGFEPEFQAKMSGL